MNTIETIIKDINKLRKNTSNGWYIYHNYDFNIHIKGYKTWLQIYKINFQKGKLFSQFLIEVFKSSKSSLERVSIVVFLLILSNMKETEFAQTFTEERVMIPVSRLISAQRFEH